jgi:hypothetical protein
MEIQFTISHVFEAPTFDFQAEEEKENFFIQWMFSSLFMSKMIEEQQRKERRNAYKTTTTSSDIRSSKIIHSEERERELLKGALLTQRSYFLFCHISHNVHKNVLSLFLLL